MTSTSALYLLRSLLREAKHVNDYNFRMYAHRRVMAGFRENRYVSGAEAENAINKGLESLRLLERQRSLGEFYPTSRSVME